MYNSSVWYQRYRSFCSWRRRAVTDCRFSNEYCFTVRKAVLVFKLPPFFNWQHHFSDFFSQYPHRFALQFILIIFSHLWFLKHTRCSQLFQREFLYAFWMVFFAEEKTMLSIAFSPIISRYRFSLQPFRYRGLEVYIRVTQANIGC